MEYTTIRDATGKSMTVGPRGPHLFRSLSTSSASDFAYEEYATPISPVNEGSVVFARSANTTKELKTQEPIQSPRPQISVDVTYQPLSAATPIVLGDVQSSDIENWSTLQVCTWMHDLGFDETLTDKFHQNDISGAILMQLQWEDLKELGIQSFGKRIELWSELNHLRQSPQIPIVSPVKKM